MTRRRALVETFRWGGLIGGLAFLSGCDTGVESGEVIKLTPEQVAEQEKRNKETADAFKETMKTKKRR
jgi:hypothetical protein